MKAIIRHSDLHLKSAATASLPTLRNARPDIKSEVKVKVKSLFRHGLSFRIQSEQYLN